VRAAVPIALKVKPVAVKVTSSETLVAVNANVYAPPSFRPVSVIVASVAVVYAMLLKAKLIVVKLEALYATVFVAAPVTCS
jgi:hypothetical protein